MSKYGSGVSIAAMCMLEKNEVIEALKGNIWVGEDDNGQQMFEPADKAECENAILKAFDHMVYRFIESVAHGRVTEDLIGAKKYMGLIDTKIKKKYPEYSEHPSIAIYADLVTNAIKDITGDYEYEWMKEYEGDDNAD